MIRWLSKALFAVVVLLSGCATPRPDLVWMGAEQRGKASWYSHPFHGKRTSSGEIYNMNALTAAHPSLALNSIVEVLSETNGKSVIVRINDRLPPNRKGRIIDLSRRAARELDLLVDGVAPVKLRVLSYGNNLYVKVNRAAPDGQMYLKGPLPAKRVAPPAKGPVLSEVEGPES
jgi:rare lipoprotein A (peptidoglycan hydrolase)